MTPRRVPRRCTRRGPRPWRVGCALAALLTPLLVRCASSCPDGGQRRFDQCVHPSVSGDAASDAPQADSTVADASQETSGDAIAAGDGAAGCDGAHLLVEGRCALREVYVDSLTGDDSNDGSPRSPLKTFRKAVSGGVTHQIINFEPGLYAVSAGDDFTGLIPAGLTLRKRPGATGTATFDGGGAHSLTFAGGAVLEDLELIAFSSPLIASSGEQTLTRVRVAGARGAITLLANAHWICDSCRFEAEPFGGGALIEVGGKAKATLKHAQFVTKTAATCYDRVMRFIDVVGSGDLELEDVQLSGNFDTAVLWTSLGKLEIRSSTFAAGCYGGSLTWSRDTGPWDATAEIQDSVFAGYVDFSGAMRRFYVRRSTFKAHLAIAYPDGGIFDLGMPTRDGSADPGENSIAQLMVVGSATVFASGNIWNANQQGADAHGRYPDGHVVTVESGQRIDGPNFSALALEPAPTTLFF